MDALSLRSPMRPCVSGWSSRRLQQAWSCWPVRCCCCAAFANLEDQTSRYARRQHSHRQHHLGRTHLPHACKPAQLLSTTDHATPVRLPASLLSPSATPFLPPPVTSVAVSTRSSLPEDRLLPQAVTGVVASRMVSPEYFRALDIPIVQGEGFSEEDMTGSQQLHCSQQAPCYLFSSQAKIPSASDAVQ